jgi:hypothetical protein
MILDEVLDIVRHKARNQRNLEWLSDAPEDAELRRNAKYAADLLDDLAGELEKLRGP